MKNGNHFSLVIVFLAYFNSGYAHERGKTISFFLYFIWWKKMEDSDLMEYSDFVQVQVKYLSPAVYI